jgi:uncharacterized transporter YbjL
VSSSTCLCRQNRNTLTDRFLGKVEAARWRVEPLLRGQQYVHRHRINLLPPAPRPWTFILLGVIAGAAFFLIPIAFSALGAATGAIAAAIVVGTLVLGSRDEES